MIEGQGSERPRVACVVGARPNFVKIAPVLAGLASVAPELAPILVHTGQHYDAAMSGSFFAELGIRPPDVHLEVGSGSHGAQTARVLERYEAWLLGLDALPALTVVVGDVNSTLACALASVKAGVPVAHVEAGLRSFDRTMPEEVNRVVVDAIADLLLVSEPAGVENLRREGRPEAAIRLVGNVMIDVLERELPAARVSGTLAAHGLEAGRYALTTVHRPANVDSADALAEVVEILHATAERLPLVVPLHPRTAARLRDSGLDRRLDGSPVRLLPPLPYRELLALQAGAALVLTDSGGMQEETTALGVPCLTLRDNTERPITVDTGSSTLVGRDRQRIATLVDDVLAGRYDRGARPALWDGRAGERVAREIASFLGGR